jgi:hypothetical protein
MAAKKGDGLLMVYGDVAAEHEEECNRWYNEEHIPERLAIPGVLNAARYEAVAGGPTYTTVHEMASLDVWQSQAWDAWRTAVTPVWSSEIRLHMVHAAGSPGVYRRIFPA